MSDISLHGIFGALCVMITIGIGVVGIFIALIAAGVRSSSGSIGFGAALKRAIAGPAVCTAVGLLSLAWLAGASSNETVDDMGPFVVLAGVLGGVVVGIVVARRLRRAQGGLSLVLPLLLASLATPARGQDTLVFRWPDHLRCEVERKTRLALGTHTTDDTDRYQLEATRERSGWLIRRTYLGGIEGPTARESASRRELKSDRLLPFRVRKDGSFAGTVVDASMRERLRAREREWRGPAGGPQAAMTKGVPYPGSEKQLTAQARGEWADLVGGWAGAPLPTEKPLSRQARREFQLPVLGPTTVTVRERVRRVGTVPCGDGGPAGCVELEWVMEPDLASVNRALAASQRQWERAGGNAEGNEAGMVHEEMRKTLVTDPRTLVPMRLTKRLEMQMKDERARSTHEEIITFACAAAP